MTSANPVSLEKLSLARRIERYLDAVEREGKGLGPRETDLLCRVLALLETDACIAGADVMLMLERPSPHGTPQTWDAIAGGPTLSVSEQRANLARVLDRP